MRDYGKVSPQFWIGKTGKALRKHGPEAQIVALYLMTNPHANMLGLYYMPVMFIAHETGLGMDGAAEGLSACIEAGFCQYDGDTEMVWVIEMAHYQIAEGLKPDDKRCIGIQNEYNALPQNLFLAEFHGKYQESFHMTSKRESSTPSYAPCMTLASQEQEQEQDKEQEQEQEQQQEQELVPATGVAVVAPAKKSVDSAKKAKAESATASTWQAYTAAYLHRYGAEPVRNKVTNSIMANFVNRLGADESPFVAAFYVSHNKAWYVQQAHAVGPMLSDAEALRTQWFTNRRVTSTQAQQADRTQTNGDVWGQLIAEQEAKEAANGQ